MEFAIGSQQGKEQMGILLVLKVTSFQSFIQLIAVFNQCSGASISSKTEKKSATTLLTYTGDEN